MCMVLKMDVIEIQVKTENFNATEDFSYGDGQDIFQKE